MTRVFVIRPFAKKEDPAKKELDFERVHDELISPVLKAMNLSGGTAGEIVEPGNIREDMFSLILEADLVICDITIHNANVFYELGIRSALRKKHTILIKGEPTATGSPPFDLLTDRYLPYDIDNPASARDELSKVITAALQSDRETDSPIFKMLPSLKETDQFAVQVLPLDFSSEVERALAAKSRGWLRLLAQELRSRKFQSIGLQLVGTAQWHLMDYEGARESLEVIREDHGDNVATNLALANIYERMYSSGGKLEVLKSSDQAIAQVLASKDASPRNRAEALALKGRNLKTLWRLKFKDPDLDTVNKRRKAAMNQMLCECYEAYRKAFDQDLNHFYPGLTALQMGTIFLRLSEGEDMSWKNLFKDDKKAKACRSKLKNDVKDLHLLVRTSIGAKLNQLDQTDPDHIWARISEADLLFLNEPNEQRVIQRYKDAIPKDNPFAWDAAKGQLQVFADLGINATLADKVIAAVDRQYTEQKPLTDKALHVVLFAGHRVDTPERVEGRFPPQQEGQARQFIRDALSALNQGQGMLGLASAAPGADILFHEVCADLNIRSILCLPMPERDYARLEFEHLDDWRSRFLNLKNRKEVYELSDRAGLPKWLYDSGTNPWERGNNWVLQIALASQATLITLVALWDGKNEGYAPGGTAHMVHLARNTGKVDVKIIDAKQLLK